jgi:hypothetical protein
MGFRRIQAAIGKGSMMAWIIAVIVLWSTMAIAGMNENLIEASSRGDLPEVKSLLAKGAEVNARTITDGYTAGNI